MPDASPAFHQRWGSSFLSVAWPLLALAGGLLCSVPAQAVEVDNLVITSFRVTPQAIRAGEAFTVEFTVMNRGTDVAETQDPPPGMVYRQGESWDSREFEPVPGRVRVGVALSGPRGYAFPYRWGLGGPLGPTQSRTITGKIGMTVPGAYSMYPGIFVEGQGYRRENETAYGLRVTDDRAPRPGGVRALVRPARIMVNGELIQSPQPPIIIQGVVFVPIRFPSEHLGARVDWDNRRKVAEIDRGAREVRLQIGNLNAWVNNDLVTLYERPFIRNARTYVPLRFVAESLGAQVTWDGPTRTIRIRT